MRSRTGILRSRTSSEMRSVCGAVGLLGCAIVAAATLSCTPLQDMNDEPSGFEPQQRRSAFQSLCALSAVECTTSWPTADIAILVGEGQAVGGNADIRFTVTGTPEDGAIPVTFDGSGSMAGVGAMDLSFEWSLNAADEEMCTLEPGEIIGTTEMVEILLQPGFHYVRLYVENDIIREEVPVAGCETLEDVPSFDFLEVEVEVVDGTNP